jgi:hypothetical protein
MTEKSEILICKVSGSLFLYYLEMPAVKPKLVTYGVRFVSEVAWSRSGLVLATHAHTHARQNAGRGKRNKKNVECLMSLLFLSFFFFSFSVLVRISLLTWGNAGLICELRGREEN